MKKIILILSVILLFVQYNIAQTDTIKCLKDDVIHPTENEKTQDKISKIFKTNSERYFLTAFKHSLGYCLMTAEDLQKRSEDDEIPAVTYVENIEVRLKYNAYKDYSLLTLQFETTTIQTYLPAGETYYSNSLCLKTEKHLRNKLLKYLDLCAFKNNCMLSDVTYFYAWTDSPYNDWFSYCVTYLKDTDMFFISLISINK